MAGELTSFGIQKLWGLLSQECELFRGVEDQVTGLKCDINWLSSFLKDADTKKHTSAVVKTCVEEIKEIIFDGEDTIETFLLKQNLGRSTGIKMRIKRLACIIPDRRENSLDVAGIRKRISEVTRKMKSFGVVQQIITDDGYMQMQPLYIRQKEMRKTFPKDNESGFMAMEENVKTLVGHLVEEDNVQVVSITGMGGLGKTTLARQVFNHEDVQRHFDGLAWVCVSQDFTRKNVWQKILEDLKPKEEENIILEMTEQKKILEMTESTLQSELYRLLETSKSLIVLDDVWKREDWEVIKPIFPPTKGWKLLVTSRNESIVGPRNTTYSNLKPKFLTTEDSWTLFQRIVFASEIKIDEEMEELGKQMIKCCGGLPLAIKVLGGMLAEKYTLHDWRRLSENIGSHLVGGRTDFNDDNNNSCNYVLSLSFEELPSYLKHCFLYLAHFPEDHEINVEKMYYYWAAEGIFEPRHYDGEIIRDVGDVYIDELVRRNMVISERDVTTLRFETCHLHDMMREICLLKSKEENFLQITSSRPSTASFNQSTVTSRRFVSHNPTTLHVERDINNSKLRSLMVVQVNKSWGARWKLSGSSYTRLELLRVLDLSDAEFRGRKLASGIGKLIHLRYLSLKDAKVSHLPYSLGNLKLLIYLDLDIRVTGSKFVPNVLMGMQELRYLVLPDYMGWRTKLELSNLVKLESMKNFSTMNSSLEDLCGMIRLRTLTIKLFDETSMETLSASIGGMRHLETLNIIQFWRRMKEEIKLDFVHVKKMSLRLRMPKLPKEEHFPSRLTVLKLCLCRLKKDPMPILENLLQLKVVWLDFKSFSGRRMVCSDSGFPQLQELTIWGLNNWEEWIVEEGSMPFLHSLRISRCQKLKELPDGMRFITSLKNLSMDEKWKKRLSEEGKDYYKVQHVPSIKFIRNDRFKGASRWDLISSII
ncbi:PREDICTED: probable disease resistance protein RF45 [Camelina sativa]|uniref:Probable disease resistance protein RF45 n=1 Tax=Camelina sativa TaxID=90675 RepID=A0ABM1RR83_CAMSA|nr:PREDICTED: probable disease resistance protein RF45 [Camelina sativa]XP_019101521.1 PREDICTED: probable disease resistance protein RF45 [Camelina sativa]